MNKQFLYIFLVFIGIAAIIAGVVMLRGNEDNWICSNGTWVKHGQPTAAMPTTPCPGAASSVTASENSQISNPASVNCKDKGGNSVIKTKPDGSQYSLCYFEDNRACEEWAMYRGECPVGGVKTTGFDTEAQSFCAWSGGSTFATDNAICTFKDGSTCLAQDFYIGICNKGETNLTAKVLTYKNDQYGFSLQLPATWEGYLTKATVRTNGTSLYFGFPTWDDIFAVGVYDQAQWDKIKNDGISSRLYIGKNSKYYFVGNEAQAIGDANLTPRRAEFSQIISTFKAF